jgi:hypothetical protein
VWVRDVILNTGQHNPVLQSRFRPAGGTFGSAQFIDQVVPATSAVDGQLADITVTMDGQGRALAAYGTNTAAFNQDHDNQRIVRHDEGRRRRRQGDRDHRR